MAFFKFRRGDDESPGATQPESVEGLRRRARHRLIGAVVLVAIGVVAFQLLFDTQPRPIAVDIPIEIPDRNKVKPLPHPTSGATSNAAAGPVTNAVAKVEDKDKPAPAAPPTATVAASTPAPAPATPASRPEPKDKPKAEPRAESKPESKPEPKADPKADAKAAAVAGRYVVQVGAFADVGKAREMRLKVEKAGFKTYTNVAETKEGKRIRVRVGPYNSRAEADKAADRIKGLDLPAAILSL